jgi:ADP-ribose pyrophosphatase YjhB (NUDIX family)
MTHECPSDPDFWIESSQSATTLCLAYRVDTYGGVFLDSSELPQREDDFRRALSCSLEVLHARGFQKAFWIRIPASKIEFVIICFREFGFYVHHAKKEYFMLAKWAHPAKPDPIPPPSTHQVGVGCVIDRGDGCIILVKEQVGPASKGGGIWKLPTGLVDPTEDICSAAVREAKEETSLSCSFSSIIVFRQSHGTSPASGSMSDLFFMCHLKPAFEGQDVIIQESEIKEYVWAHHTELHNVTMCSEGTAAWELIECVRKLVADDRESTVITAEKLPAWRRKNCEQYIFKPNRFRND